MWERESYLLDGPSRGSGLLRDLTDRTFRQKTFILAGLVLWTAGMAAFLYYRPPSYESEIKFLVNNHRAGVVVSPQYNNGPVQRDYVDESIVATEIQLLSN